MRVQPPERTPPTKLYVPDHKTVQAAIRGGWQPTLQLIAIMTVGPIVLVILLTLLLLLRR